MAYHEEDVCHCVSCFTFTFTSMESLIDHTLLRPLNRWVINLGNQACDDKTRDWGKCGGIAGGGFKIDEKHGTIHNEDRLFMRLSYSDIHLIFKDLK